MSQSAPPPLPQSHQPAPVEGNPYAGEPGAAAPGMPAAPRPGAPYPPHQSAQGAPLAPPAPAAPVRGNLVAGLLAALGAAVVAGALYGVVIGLTQHEIGWAAVGVGFVIGVAAGKAGGRNAALAIASVVLALAAVYLGQLVGEAMIIADAVHRGFSEVFLDHFSVVQQSWKADADPLTFLFYGIAGYAAFTGTKKAAG